MRRRWWVLGAVVLATAAAGFGAKNLGLATNYRVYFSDDNPDLLAYDAVENIYTRNDNVLFVVKPNEGDVFTPRVLELVRELTNDAWQIPYSTRVDGITNFQHSWADGDDLIVEDLVGGGEITQEMVDRARDVVFSEPLLPGRLISEDGRTTGVNVRISLPGESSGELPETVNFVRELEREYRERYPDVEIHTSGISMLNAAFAEAPLRDMPLVMPLMFLVLVAAMFGFLRSSTGTVATLAIVGFSSVTALGVAGHLGVSLDPTSSAAPIIILTLAVADSIHILVTYFFLGREGKTKSEALVEAMVVNAQPVFLTSITTAIGFLTLNFGDAPPFRLLGNITAFGVMVAWLYSITLLPAVLSILPFRVKSNATETPLTQRWVDALGGWVARRHRAVLAAVGTVAVILAGSISRIDVNDQYFEYFDPSMAFRQATDFTLANLTGLYGTTFSLDSGEEQGVSDPDYLDAVERFTAWLESRPAVVHVNSFTHIMKRLNRNMHGDDPAEYDLPDAQELGAQYLLLYELSLPYGLDVNDQINLDKSALRLDVTYGNVDTSEIEEEVALAEAWLQENGTESMKDAKATGPSIMFAKITRRNIASMVLGTGFGFLLIAGILTVALRSVRLGVISLIPNILPAMMAFGVWAFLIGEVGFAVSVVAGLSIGIIVDDTVHFLSKYNRARATMSAPDSVRYAFRSVGAAILGTTFIVAAGFAMLGLSTFRVTAYMGLLTSLTVVCALVIDFLLLPALLVAFDRRQVAPVKA